MIEATCVRTIRWTSERRVKLYKLSHSTITSGIYDPFEYIYVSAVKEDIGTKFLLNDNYNLHETFIFASDENGKVISYKSLPGSMAGVFDCDKTVRECGWLRLVEEFAAAPIKQRKVYI